jgi:hypothetical protein
MPRGVRISIPAPVAALAARVRATLVSPLGQRVCHAVSVVFLMLVLGAHLTSWVRSNAGMLFDPLLQTDDARTTLFPFHRYGSQGTLGDDPIANEMLALVPPAVRFLYRVTVPLTDVFVAAKIVQGVSLAILVWACVVLVRSRRAGLGAAALLAFLMFHDWFAVDRIAGGLPRSFGFPCFALWLAGVVGNNRAARWAGPIIAALTYPSVMNMLLGAEGLLALRDMGRVRFSVTARRLLRFGALVGVCVVCALPAVTGGEDRGPIHTLEQAEKEPAFGKKGRLWLLPFDPPTQSISKSLIGPLTPKGGTPVPALAQAYKKDTEMLAVLLLASFLLLPFFRWAPSPRVAVAFFVGTLVLFAASRILAFRLYSPERYYSFGMRMATTALVFACCAQLWFWVRPPWRSTFRNFSVAGVMFFLWSVTGSGIAKNTGMTIDGRRDANLYAFIRTLPKDVRFASHIFDGDGIPYFGARATMGGFETLQPWFVDSWKRQKARAEDTLRALYATDRGAVLDYAAKNHVTHLLINVSRYGGDLKKNSGSFDPFTDFARDLVRGKSSSDMVLADLPPSAVVFREGRFRVVSVEKLRQAWQ